MNPIDKIYQAMYEKTAIINKGDESLVLLMEREPIRQKELFSSEAEAAAEIARMANVLFWDCQVADHRQIVTLDMAYEKSLEQILLNYKNWKEKEQDALTLEGMCFPMLLDFAMDALDHAKGRLPSGFQFHTTEIYPMGWKQQLGSGFSEIDLVDSVLSHMKTYVKAYRKRERVVDVLLRYGKYVNQQDCYDKLQNMKHQLTESYYCMGIFSDLDSVPEKIWDIFTEYILPFYPEELPKQKEDLKTYMKSKEEIYQVYEKSIWNCLYVGETNSSFLEKYKQEVRETQQKLEQIREQIKLAIMKNVHETRWGYRLLPSKIDKTFETIILKIDMDEFMEDSELVWEGSKECLGTELLFAGKHPMGIDIEKLRGHMAIEVGFLLKRLEIKREWFYPELFHLIPELKLPITWRFPVSVLIIKDITLRFSFDEVTKPYMDMFMKHALQNNGFLCFREKYSTHKTICTMSGKTITCKINWPMVAGYYVKDIE